MHQSITFAHVLIFTVIATVAVASYFAYKWARKIEREKDDE